MTDSDAARLADRCWRVFEPLHALTYFAPESREAADAIGLQGWWMCYFAFRAAPLGVVPASVVRSTFFNFHKSRTDRAIPDAWALASIEAVLGARAVSVASALSLQHRSSPRSSKKPSPSSSQSPTPPPRPVSVRGVRWRPPISHWGCRLILWQSSGNC